MTSQLKQDLKSYYKEISFLLVGNATEKKKFISDFKVSINEFVEKNPDATIDDIAVHFGRPEEIAKAFLEPIDPSRVKNAINWKKLLVISAIVIVALLIILYVVIFIIVDNGNVKEYTVENAPAEILNQISQVTSTQ